MGFDRVAAAEGDRPQPPAPVVGERLRHQHLAADLVEHQVQQLVLAGHVGVGSHRRDPELLGQAPHRDGLEALLVGELDRGVDDLLAAHGRLLGSLDVHHSYTVQWFSVRCTDHSRLVRPL
jgi:hypothetical protein